MHNVVSDIQQRAYMLGKSYFNELKIFIDMDIHKIKNFLE